MGGIKKTIHFFYFKLKGNWFIWYYLINLKPRTQFRRNRPKLSITQERIVQDLLESGFSVSSVEEMFGKNVLNSLLLYTDKCISRAETQTKKQFLKFLWDVKPKIDFENPFVTITINKLVVDIANSYLGMWTKLHSYTLASTIPANDGDKEIQSQRWHRDPEEKRFLKMFIYVSDVDKDSGPFIYLRKSTFGNKYGKLFPQKPPAGSYPELGSVEKNVSDEDVIVFTGKKGAIIFADTTGLHKGGYSRKKERIMFTAFFSAPSYHDKHWYYGIEKYQSEINRMPKEVGYTLS